MSGPHAPELADALCDAKEPLTHAELQVAIGRKRLQLDSLRLWERAGIVERVIVHRSPTTGIPGLYRNEVDLVCYRYTPLGLRIYWHYYKLRKKGITRVVFPL